MRDRTLQIKGMSRVEKIFAPGVVTVDLHGKNCYQAKIAVEAALRRAGGEVYRLRLIHGFHGGSALKEMIAREYAARPGVLGIQAQGDGVTLLILRKR